VTFVNVKRVGLTTFESHFLKHVTILQDVIDWCNIPSLDIPSLTKDFFAMHEWNARHWPRHLSNENLKSAVRVTSRVT
jgi:hypothetical protein